MNELPDDQAVADDVERLADEMRAADAAVKAFEQLNVSAEVLLAALGFPVHPDGTDRALSSSNQDRLDDEVREAVKETVLAVLDSIKKNAEQMS